MYRHSRGDTIDFVTLKTREELIKEMTDQEKIKVYAQTLETNNIVGDIFAKNYSNFMKILKKKIKTLR